jgi:hypothetical protein
VTIVVAASAAHVERDGSRSMERVLTAKKLEAIRVDREEHGFSLTMIMEKHGLRRSTAYSAIKDLDGSKVQRASPTRRVVQPLDVPPRPPISKANLGEATRQLIAGRMLAAGLGVFQPIGEDTPVDLLVLRSDGVALKCQCKTMFVDKKTDVHFMPLISVRKWGPNAKAVPHRYTREEVDFFIGYAHEVDTMFVFPFEATAQFKARLSVWLLREPMNHNQHDRFDPSPFKNAFHLLAD